MGRRSVLFAALVVLLALPASAGVEDGPDGFGTVRVVERTVVPHGAGEISIPGPCTRAQQETCTLACYAEKKANELVADAQCTITAPVGVNAFRCDCKVIALVPDAPQPDPEPITASITDDPTPMRQ